MKKLRRRSMAPRMRIARITGRPVDRRNRLIRLAVLTLCHLLPVTLIAIVAVGGLVAMPTEFDGMIDAQAIVRHADDMGTAKLAADLVKTLGTCMDFDVPSGDWIPAVVVVADTPAADSRRAPPPLYRTNPRPPRLA